MLPRGRVCGGVSEPEQSEEDIKEGSPCRESEPEEGVHPWGHLGMGIQRPGAVTTPISICAPNGTELTKHLDHSFYISLH